MEDVPRLLRIPTSECPDIFGYVFHDTNGPPPPPHVEDSVVPLERNLYGHPLAGLLWQRQFEEFLLGLGWEKVHNWECLLVHRKQGLFLSVCVDDIKNDWKESRIWLLCGRTRWNLWILTNQHHFFIMYIRDALTVNVNRTKTLSISLEKCSNHEFLQLQLKNYQEVKSLTQNRLRGPATWKDMLKNALKDTANWQTKRRSNRTQFQRLAWMITTSRTVWELIVRCMFSNRLEMLVLGSNWWTRHLLDSKLTCSGSHHMDTSVWPTVGKHDVLHSSHKRLPAILSCG